MVHLPLADIERLDPAELDQLGPGLGRRPAADPEVLGDPRKLVAAIGAVVGGLLVPEQATDQNGCDGRRDRLGEAGGEGAEQSPGHGHRAPAVGHLGEHRPEAREIVNAELVGRDCERDVVLAHRHQSEPVQGAEIAPELADGPLVPCPADQAGDLVHRVEGLGSPVLGAGVAAAFIELVSREIDPVLPSGHMTRMVQPPGHGELVDRDAAEAALDSVFAFSDR